MPIISILHFRFAPNQSIPESKSGRQVPTIKQLAALQLSIVAYVNTKANHITMQVQCEHFYFGFVCFAFRIYLNCLSLVLEIIWKGHTNGVPAHSLEALPKFSTYAEMTFTVSPSLMRESRARLRSTHAFTSARTALECDSVDLGFKTK